MAISPRDSVLATLVIAAEARNQPHAAKQGVAASFFNRLRTGHYGPTITHVCLMREQYSSLNDDKGDNRNLLAVADLPEDGAVWQDCMKAYVEVANGVDPTDGATHYYDTSIPAPYWTQKQPDGKQAVMTIKIGNLVFFKDVP